MEVEEYKKNILSVGRFDKYKLSPKSHMVCQGVGSVGTLSFVMNLLFLYGDDVKEVYVDMTDGWKKRHGYKINPYDYIFNQELCKPRLNPLLPTQVFLKCHLYFLVT